MPSDPIADMVLTDRAQRHAAAMRQAESLLTALQMFIGPELAFAIHAQIDEKQEQAVFEYGGVHWHVVSADGARLNRAPYSVTIAPDDRVVFGSLKCARNTLQFAQFLYGAVEAAASASDPEEGDAEE